MIRQPTLDELCSAIIAVGVLNFVAFIVIALLIGGDAVNGHANDGHFYLSNHGKPTEVSEAVFRYSYAHAMSLWITHPAAMIAAVVQRRSRAK